MKPKQAILLGSLLILVAWGSLFATVLNQAAETHKLLRTDQKLLNQDTAILNAQKKQPTTTDLNTKLIAVQAHVDCLFNLATQPNRFSTYIKDASKCTISPSNVTGVSAPSAPQPPSKVSVSSSSPQSVPNSDNKQANKPIKSTVCKLTLGLIDCK